MKFINKFKDFKSISEHLKYHIENSIPLNENVFRMESDSWCNLWCEARALYQTGKLDIHNSDEQIILEKLQTGVSAIYQGKKVVLDSPKNVNGESKRSLVYIDSGRKDSDGNIIAKIVRFGDPNLSIKNHDKAASKSFRARHKCNLKTDKSTAGFWSCNVHLFWKQLGLQTSDVW